MAKQLVIAAFGRLLLIASLTSLLFVSNVINEIWEPKGEFVSYKYGAVMKKTLNGSKLYRFTKIQLELSEQCDVDFFEVRVGKSKLWGRICGLQELNNTVLWFQTPMVDLYLFSDEEHDGISYGFSLIQDESFDDKCFHVFNSSSSGTIGLKHWTESVRSCKFIITTSALHGLKLTFQKLNLLSCGREKLTVYDISVTPRRAVADYCGAYKTPQTLFVESHYIEIEREVIFNFSCINTSETKATYGFLADYEEVPYTVLRPYVLCPEPSDGFILHKKFCYKILKAIDSTWEDAESRCKNEGNV